MEETVMKEVSKICEKEGKSGIIPALQKVQELDGFVSKEAMKYIAQVLNIPDSEVYGVATFYNQFRLIPKGKHLIKVCRGTACHVKGSGQLLSLVENDLGIKVGETTKDKRFSLESVACLGACSIAPVMMIDDKFFGHISAEDIPKILSQYAE